MTLLQTHSHSPSGEMTAGIADSPSWLSLSHLKSQQVYFGASKLLKVDITNKANIYLSLFHSMVSSLSPKQDTFNSSLISVLFTQQKPWTHFEAQVSKPNAMLACRPMKRHFCETEMPLCTWKGSSTTRGSFIVQDSLAKLLSHMSSFAGEETSPHPQLSRPSSLKLMPGNQ